MSTTAKTAQNKVHLPNYSFDHFADTPNDRTSQKPQVLSVQ
ncbi:hypothetical protein S7335_161 [Synechococcus sp. PCC 7335]|nr:hypothetical protein [Synechococcus sp. PCC 7335]EDX82983.1 hypothetical protein S7335_161 [Synechococcus sp. PCC 7335]